MIHDLKPRRHTVENDPMTTSSERAKKEAAQVFLRLWVDRGRMPDADTAKYLIDAFATFAADAVREEREACAVVVEADPPDKNAMTPGDLAVYRVHAKNIARRIRARTPASGEEKG